MNKEIIAIGLGLMLLGSFGFLCIFLHDEWVNIKKITLKQVFKTILGLFIIVGFLILFVSMP